ncbi:MAG: arylesterase [Gammaproteobacteria bacterium]|nr:arylesterase [Gammaproteobacteria bacterium]
MLKRLLMLITFILPTTVSAQQQTIVVVGDSLSAAYGMTQKEGWVNLLAIKMKEATLPYRIVNTSISGETTHGALARFSTIISTHQPTIIIIALGGNDGLRGMPLKAMKQNLASMIQSAQTANSDVLLAGMQLPPNYGRTFTQKFSNSYQQLADEYNIALLPFLLKGMDQDLTLFQSDGIHPLNSAQPMILDNVWPHLMPLLTTAAQ